MASKNRDKRASPKPEEDRDTAASPKPEEDGDMAASTNRENDAVSLQIEKLKGRYTVLAVVLPIVVAAAMGGLATIGKLGFDKLNTKVDSINDRLVETTLVGVKAADYLKIDDHNPVLKDKPVAVSGKVVKPLPSGVQIWVGSEKVQSDNKESSVPTTAFGIDEGGPCRVNLLDSTFNCDNIYIGKADETGDYRVFIGLANSDQARALVSGIRDQMCSPLADNQSSTSEVKALEKRIHDPQAKRLHDLHICARKFGHVPPDGIRWLPAVVMVRS